MAAVISLTFEFPKQPTCSPSKVRWPAVERAFEESDGRPRVELRMSDAACKARPSEWLCHIRHRELLTALERASHLLHWVELISGAVIDALREKARVHVAIARSVIRQFTGWCFRKLGRWLGTVVGSTLWPCGCGALIGAGVGVVAGALVGAIVLHHLL